MTLAEEFKSRNFSRFTLFVWSRRATADMALCRYLWSMVSHFRTQSIPRPLPELLGSRELVILLSSWQDASGTDRTSRVPLRSMTATGLGTGTVENGLANKHLGPEYCAYSYVLLLDYPVLSPTLSTGSSSSP
jgi:hypothetical protein